MSVLTLSSPAYRDGWNTQADGYIRVGASPTKPNLVDTREAFRHLDRGLDDESVIGRFSGRPISDELLFRLTAPFRLRI